MTPSVFSLWHREEIPLRRGQPDPRLGKPQHNLQSPVSQARVPGKGRNAGRVTWADTAE